MLYDSCAQFKEETMKFLRYYKGDTLANFVRTIGLISIIGGILLAGSGCCDDGELMFGLVVVGAALLYAAKRIYEYNATKKLSKSRVRGDEYEN